MHTIPPKRRKIILASASPRRKELLEKTGLQFEVVASDYEEDMTLPYSPTELARHISAGKAEAVAKNEPDAIIIAADTFVVFEGEKLGKPHTKKEAIAMLSRIHGRTNDIVTGYTVMDSKSGAIVSRIVSTKVYLKNLTPEEIEAYADSGEPLDKAGAYAIRGRGAAFVEKIEGDFFAAMGLPLSDLAKTLKAFGVCVF